MKDRFDHVLVLLDPGQQGGHDGLTLAASLVAAEGRLTLATVLSGPEAWALRAFAESEEVSVAEAAVIYLEQVARHVDHNGVEVTTVSGTDLNADVLEAIRHTGATALVLPSAMAMRLLYTKRRPAAGFPVPVVVAPVRPMVA